MNAPDVVTVYHVETKTWGWETWIVNNDLYCGKILHMRQGGHTSMHFHMKKHETMYCQRGSFEITLHDMATGDVWCRVLGEGDSIEIKPGQSHRINGLGPDMNELVEFSTHHENDDSFRIGKPGQW